MFSRWLTFQCKGTQRGFGEGFQGFQFCAVVIESNKTASNLLLQSLDG